MNILENNITGDNKYTFSPDPDVDMSKKSHVQ